MNQLQSTSRWLVRIVPHFSYTPLLGVTALLAFVKLALYARFLNVDNFGTLSKMLLVSSLFGIAGSFGFHLLAHRELPGLFYRGSYKRGILLLGRSAFVITVSALLLMLPLFFGGQWLGLSGLAFGLGVMHGWGQQVFMLAMIESKSRIEMMRYSKQMFIRTALSTLGGVVAAAAFRDAVLVMLAEFLITLVMTYGLIGIVLRNTRLSPTVFAAAMSKGHTVREWRVALMLLGGSLVAFFGFNADRWIAANFLASEEFGLYSFAWISLLAAQSAQFLLNAGFFPLLARRHAATPGFSAFRMTAIASVGLLAVGIVAAIIGSNIASWATVRWYPNYSPALPLFPPLLAASAFRLADFWSSYLVVIHRENTLFVVQALILIAALALWQTFSPASGEVSDAYRLALLALGLAVSSYVASAIAAFRHRVPRKSCVG